MYGAKMKHHFGDFLDRKSGHWSMVANADRYIYRIGDFEAAQKSVSIVTLSKKDENWELIATLPNLVELTLHEPSKEQLEFVSTLWRLKKLRITHARPKSIDFLARLQALEELVLEYVSGFDDIAPVGALKNLRSLHIENLRRVSDFSGLSGASSLKYLCIDGTFDWRQPIDSFDFLGALDSLEVFKLGGVRSLAPAPALLALTRLSNLKKVWIPTNIFSMEEYALVEVAFPDLEGASFNPCQQYIPRKPMPKDDFRHGLSEHELREKYPEVTIWSNGAKQIPDLDRSEYWFLGKGARSIACKSPKAQAKCDAHRQKYYEAKKAAAAQLEKVF